MRAVDGQQLGLRGLTGVLGACDVVVAADTGPLHLADAVGDHRHGHHARQLKERRFGPWEQLAVRSESCHEVIRQPNWVGIQACLVDEALEPEQANLVGIDLAPLHARPQRSVDTVVRCEVAGRVSQTGGMDVPNTSRNSGRALKRPQIEFIAARVSAYNDCFY